MNKLNKIYKSMIESWGGRVKTNKQIVYLAGGEEHPLTIDDLNLYLPTDDVLDGNTIDKVFFHPACENITSKETEVFKLIRKMTVMSLLTTFRQYPPILFGVSGKEKKGWKQHTLDMLHPIKSTKRTTRTELNKLFEMLAVEVGEDGLDNRFIHFKVTKGGGRNKATGERIYYKTKPIFPFYTEIVKRLARTEGNSDNQTVDFNNFSVSRGALKLAAHIFQQVIPAVNDPDEVEFESTTPIASRLISYLGCFGEIVDQLNRVQNTFRAEFDKANIHPINDNWVEMLDELPDVYRQVPVMDYNSHNTTEEDTQVASSNIHGLMNVNSNNIAQQGQFVQNQQQQQQQNIQGDFDLTPPPLQGGDKFVRTEVDQMNSRVLHHAVNTMTGNPVVYQCTRFGNLLQRMETQMGQGGFNPMMGGQMMDMNQMNQMGQFMTPQQMMMMQQNGMMGMQMPSSTATNTSIDPSMSSTSPTTW